MSESEFDGMAAYFEAINNPDRNDPSWPLPSFDARDWAAAFCKHFPAVDEEVALAWFASALMRGFDEAHRRGVARMRQPLDGADAQALEGALALAERERDEARAEVEELRSNVQVIAALAHAGGTYELSEHEALVEIRTRTLKAWDRKTSRARAKP